MGNATPPERPQWELRFKSDEQAAFERRLIASKYALYSLASSVGLACIDLIKFILRASLNPWVWTLLLFSTLMIASFAVGHFIGQHQMRSRIFNDYDVIKRCTVYEVPSIGNTTHLERDCGE
jgi:hypothetical protein